MNQTNAKAPASPHDFSYIFDCASRCFRIIKNDEKPRISRCTGSHLTLPWRSTGIYETAQNAFEFTPILSSVGILRNSSLVLADITHIICT